VERAACPLLDLLQQPSGKAVHHITPIIIIPARRQRLCQLPTRYGYGGHDFLRRTSSGGSQLAGALLVGKRNRRRANRGAMLRYWLQVPRAAHKRRSCPSPFARHPRPAPPKLPLRSPSRPMFRQTSLNPNSNKNFISIHRAAC
jgi:hypothetical protein